MICLCFQDVVHTKITPKLQRCLRFSAVVDYVRAWWAQRPAPMESHFWHLAAMVFLMAVDTKDLEEWGGQPKLRYGVIA